MKIKKQRLFPLIVAFGMIYGCGGETQTASEGEMDGAEDISMEEELTEEPKKVVYYATPSVVDVATVMKNSGANFSMDLLSDPANAGNYSENHKRAQNMGIYGADLAYCAMFDETQSAINYFKAVKTLVEGLGLDGAIEAELLANVEENIGDRDALIDIITELFWSADAYLADNERSDVASMIIAGAWVESMYIACDMAKNSPKNQEIRTRIGEQKLILKNLLLYMDQNAGSDAHVAEAVLELKELQKAYKNIGINQGTGNTVTNADKGETVIGNETEVQFTEENLNDISKIVTNIRNRFVTI